jgi:hypothetical protein
MPGFYLTRTPVLDLASTSASSALRNKYAMPSTPLKQAIMGWQESRLGVSLGAASTDSAPVVGVSGDASITAVRLDGRSMIVARDEWVDAFEQLTSGMHPDLLFTPFGAYELSRITLPHQMSVWGPNWYMFADSESWRGRTDHRVAELSADRLAEVDFDIFWHCYGPGSLAAFAVHQGEELIALATVKDRGEPFMEIGIDVIQGAQASGLGSAVVSAAGTWILEQGRLPIATVAPFNVPSTRTLRGVGLEYGMTEMTGVDGPFRVPPQPIGTPLPGAEIYDYYPDWAMNRSIRPRGEM